MKTLDDVMNQLSPDRRAKIEARGLELICEEMTLQALRRQLEITQEGLAERLDIRQSNVSKVEQRSDMLISAATWRPWGGHWNWSYRSLGVPLSRLTDFLRHR